MQAVLIWFYAHFVEIASFGILWIIARGIDRIEVSLRQSEHYLSLLVDDRSD